MTGFDLLGIDDVLGDISDTVTDYDYGEKQVFELLAFYKSLGEPAGFKSAVDAIEAAYGRAKVAWEPLGDDKFLRWKNATAMKQVGADASQLIAKIQAASGGRAAVVPSEEKSAVYDPNAPGVLDRAASSFHVPGWAWAVGGVVVIGVIGSVVAPAVIPLLTARAMVHR